jgi:HEAT repeat protein
VDALRASAGSLSVEQQRHWSGELKHILETHDNPLLRANAVDTLAAFSVPESNDGLRVALKDKDSSVRVAACRAWGRRSDKEAIERLAEVLGSDTDLDVRIGAARELGRFPDPLAYQALGLALQDRDPALQYRAVESLKQASGKNYGNDLNAWQTFAQGQNPGPEYTPSLAERFWELF